MSEESVHEAQAVRQLREHLRTLQAEARANEQKLSRLFEREVALLSVSTLPALLTSLIHESAPAFKVECISLVLVDHADTIAGLLALRGDDLGAWPQLQVTAQLESVCSAYATLHAPRLAPFEAHRHAGLFATPGRLRSVALVPLVQGGERIGVLNLGSGDAGRYAPDLGTDFLQRFATILALSLTNVIERERLVLMGLMDALTDLPNRRYFMQRLEQEVARSARYGHSIACLFVDGDRFKAINDRHGHGAGDQVLRSIARRLRASVRTADVPARLGGEEFVVMLPQTTEADAADLAERIRRVVADQPVTLSGGARVGEGPASDPAACVSVTVSIGVAAVVPELQMEHSSSGSGDYMRLGEALIDAADRALYRAKQAGRNRVVRASGEP